MKALTLFAASACGLALVAAAVAAPAIPGYVAAAVANPNRPATDTARDAARKPADVLAFSDVKRGDKVLELIPGGGYFTRLLSGAVGPEGVVYAAAPPVNPETGKGPSSNAPNPNFANVTPITLNPASLAVPQPVDMIFTAQNYHDFHLARLHLDVPALDKQFFALLKPGGLLIIEDHAAEPGSGLRDPDLLHRIDEAVVKQEVEGAGFALVAETDVLHNPADDHKLKVFDPAIRGHTDQFVLKFRKPRA
jgi:predicted methyltransferase